MKYVKKSDTVEATQWFKNGDHPLDDTSDKRTLPTEGKVVRYFRHPNISDFKKCQFCGNIMHLHGFIDQSDNSLTVCPGDFVITCHDYGELSYQRCSPEDFKRQYEVKE